ncbi:MAG: hypothetical protein AAF733_07895 [Verrucomicrobiota bacterium]
MKPPLSTFPGISVCLSGLILTSCEEPRLNTEKVDLEPESELVAGGEELIDPIETARRAVIGRTFATLTLGTRTYSEAKVIDITDEAIVVSSAKGTDEISWGDVSEKVRDRWGYDPEATPFPEPVLAAQTKPKEEASLAHQEEEPAKILPPQKSSEDLKELARLREMLEAQRKGMEILESDLSRHSLTLAGLKNELRTVRIQQSNQGGGIRVERIGGESQLIDRRQQAKEIQARIQVEEQMVAQLTKSLEKARGGYLKLSQEISRLSNP